MAMDMELEMVLRPPQLPMPPYPPKMVTLANGSIAKLAGIGSKERHLASFLGRAFNCLDSIQGF